MLLLLLLLHTEIYVSCFRKERSAERHLLIYVAI